MAQLSLTSAQWGPGQYANYLTTDGRPTVLTLVGFVRRVSGFDDQDRPRPHCIMVVEPCREEDLAAAETLLLQTRNPERGRFPTLSTYVTFVREQPILDNAADFSVSRTSS